MPRHRQPGVSSERKLQPTAGLETAPRTARASDIAAPRAWSRPMSVPQEEEATTGTTSAAGGRIGPAPAARPAGDVASGLVRSNNEARISQRLSVAPAGQEAQEAPGPRRRQPHASIPRGTRAGTCHPPQPLQRAGKTPRRASHQQLQQGCREECCLAEARLHQPSSGQRSLQHLTRLWPHSHRQRKARRTHDRRQKAAHAPARQ